MPDSVEIPAPDSTTTFPPETTRSTSARLVVRGSGSPVGTQVRVGLVRTDPAYVRSRRSDLALTPGPPGRTTFAGMTRRQWITLDVAATVVVVLVLSVLAVR